jgi:hypothetical protein
LPSGRSATGTKAPPSPSTVDRRPGIPTITETAVGDGTVAVTWAPNDINGLPVTGYQIDLYTQGWDSDLDLLESHTVPADQTSIAFADLPNGTSYRVEIRALSGGIASEPTGDSFYLGRAPTAPTITAATPGPDSVTLQWDPPSDPGSDGVWGYTLRGFTGDSNDIVFERTLSAWELQAGGPDALLGYSIAGLPPGEHTFEVDAHGYGQSTSARSAPITVAANPAAPSDVTATPGADYGELTVTWTPPTDTKGETVTSYDDPGTTATITGLTTGTTYTFTIQATTTNGNGLPTTHTPPLTT